MPEPQQQAGTDRGQEKQDQPPKLRDKTDNDQQHSQRAAAAAAFAAHGCGT
jgi:hypothetical protein